MTKLLLSLHVLAVVVAVGPVTVAASMFPAALRRAAGPEPDPAAVNLPLLHRICRVYALIALAVPVFGLATAAALGVLGTGWLVVSIALTATAAAILALMILPDQRVALAMLGTQPERTASAAGRLAMTTGIFNLLWVIVTVMMVVRPGSTTGA
ncbi:membrane protein [Nocardia veterana]|uniref:Uncharacterized protein n=1 Tax=Nocardia veterana TaxID=132249 RepID=A0A7X6LZ93_9NOCA|nr:membrane protein [Nocardia veterana]NKY87328.1 hypothetical protein [Nocardia veterana]